MELTWWKERPDPYIWFSDRAHHNLRYFVPLFIHSLPSCFPMFSTFFVCVRGRVGGSRSWVFLCSLGSPLTEPPKCWDLLPSHMRGGCFYFFLWLVIEQLFKKATAAGRALSHLPSSWSAGYSLCITESEFG